MATVGLQIRMKLVFEVVGRSERWARAVEVRERLKWMMRSGNGARM